MADVLKHSVWAAGSLPTPLPPVPPDKVLHSLTVSIVSSAEQAPERRNLAQPGTTVEAFSCAPLAPNLVGRKIEGILMLTGDTRGTRWWVSGIRVLP